MKIRKAKKEDFKKYLRLRIEGLEDYSRLSGEKLKIAAKQIKDEFNSLFLPRRRIVFFVEENKEIRGFIIGSLTKNLFQIQGYVDDIFVKKEFRGKGCGTKLINEFIKWSKERGATSVRFGVRKNNTRAIKFYESLGFEIKHYEMEKEI